MEGTPTAFPSAEPGNGVKTTTVTVRVNTDNGKVSIAQSPDPGTGGPFVFEIASTGSGAVGVRAYVGLLDHSELAPDAATSSEGLQDVVFPFQDAGGSATEPTFLTQTGSGAVAVSVMVFFPAGSSFQPMESVVIVDW